MPPLAPGRILTLPPEAIVSRGELGESETPQDGIGGLEALAPPNSAFGVFDPVCGVVEVPYSLRPRLEVVGSPPTLRWRSRPGANHQVERRAKWDAGVWSEWTRVTAGGRGRSCVELTDVAGLEEGYFRVIVDFRRGSP
jgi:hypothetical protein